MYIYFKTVYNPYAVKKAKYIQTFDNGVDRVNLCTIDGKFGLIRDNEITTKEEYDRAEAIEKTENEIADLQEKLKQLKNS